MEENEEEQQIQEDNDTEQAKENAGKGAKKAARKVKNAAKEGGKKIWEAYKKLWHTNPKAAAILTAIIASIILIALLILAISDASVSDTKNITSSYYKSENLNEESKEAASYYSTSGSYLLSTREDLQNITKTFLSSTREKNSVLYKQMKKKFGSGLINGKKIDIDERKEMYEHILSSEKYNFNNIEWRKYNRNSGKYKEGISTKTDRATGLVYPSDSGDNQKELSYFVGMLRTYMQVWYIPYSFALSYTNSGVTDDVNTEFAYQIMKEAYHKVTVDRYAMETLTKVSQYENWEEYDKQEITEVKCDKQLVTYYSGKITSYNGNVATTYSQTGGTTLRGPYIDGNEISYVINFTGSGELLLDPSWIVCKGFTANISISGNTIKLSNIIDSNLESNSITVTYGSTAGRIRFNIESSPFTTTNSEQTKSMIVYSNCEDVKNTVDKANIKKHEETNKDAKTTSRKTSTNVTYQLSKALVFDRKMSVDVTYENYDESNPDYTHEISEDIYEEGTTKSGKITGTPSGEYCIYSTNSKLVGNTNCTDEVRNAYKIGTKTEAKVSIGQNVTTTHYKVGKRTINTYTFMDKLNIGEAKDEAYNMVDLASYIKGEEITDEQDATKYLNDNLSYDDMLYYQKLVKNEKLNRVDLINAKEDIVKKYMRGQDRNSEYIGYSRDALFFAYETLKDSLSKHLSEFPGSIRYGSSLGLKVTYDFASVQSQGIFNGPYAWPVPSNLQVIAIYGYSWWYYQGPDTGARHSGVDISPDPNNKDNTVVVAAAAGKVSAYDNGMGASSSFNDGGLGNYIEVKHEDGSRTLYGHLKTGTFKVNTGDEVVKGQEMAIMGSSGNSTGTHTHFMIYDSKGTLVDPLSYFNTVPNNGNKIQYADLLANSALRSNITMANPYKVVASTQNISASLAAAQKFYNEGGLRGLNSTGATEGQTWDNMYKNLKVTKNDGSIQYCLNNYKNIVIKYSNMYGVNAAYVVAKMCLESSGGRTTGWTTGAAAGPMQIEKSAHLNHTISAKNVLTGETDEVFASQANMSDTDTNIKMGVMIYANKLKGAYNNPIIAAQMYNYGNKSWFTDGGSWQYTKGYCATNGKDPQQVANDYSDVGWLYNIMEYNNNAISSHKGSPWYAYRFMLYAIASQEAINS